MQNLADNRGQSFLKVCRSKSAIKPNGSEMGNSELLPKIINSVGDQIKDEGNMVRTIQMP